MEKEVEVVALMDIEVGIAVGKSIKIAKGETGKLPESLAKWEVGSERAKWPDTEAKAKK